jgi:hypothetical protein
MMLEEKNLLTPEEASRGKELEELCHAGPNADIRSDEPSRASAIAFAIA